MISDKHSMYQNLNARMLLASIFSLTQQQLVKSFHNASECFQKVAPASILILISSNLEPEVRQPKAAVLFGGRPKAVSAFDRIMLVMGAGSTLRNHFDAFGNFVFMLRCGNLNGFG